MKSILVILFSILLLTSCGSDTNITNTDPGDGDNTNGAQISQSDFNNIVPPCADQSNTVNLPEAMTIMSNYSQHEATSEIFSSLQFSKSLLTNLSQAILPPISASYAEVDDITVYPDSKAYDWKIGPDTYRYIITDEGYQILFFKDSNQIGDYNQLLYVEQSEDCSNFEYVQFAIKDDGEEMKGERVFRIRYKDNGAFSDIQFGADLGDPESEDYYMRTFNDLSGDMKITVNNEIVRSYLWQSDGSGSYNIFENGTVVDSGLWSF